MCVRGSHDAVLQPSQVVGMARVTQRAPITSCWFRQLIFVSPGTHPLWSPPLLNRSALLHDDSLLLGPKLSTMVSLQARSVLSRFARPASIAFQRRPLTSLPQRGFASHQDATYPQVPYEKGENVGAKRFSQFDLEGKVFVVTGAASSPPHILKQMLCFHG